MKIKIILLSTLVVLSLVAQAQDITLQTISWTVTKTQNMSAGGFNDEQATLITYGKTKVELKSYDGSLHWSLEVVEVIGAWTNLNKNGSITYEVKGEGGNGTLTFIRETTGAKARLLLVKEDGPEITEYMLSTFVVQ